jgi:lipoprotein signal peptidase
MQNAPTLIAHSNAQSEASTPTWRSPQACGVLASTIIGSLVIDLASKEVAFRAIADAPVKLLRQDVLAVTPELYKLIPQHEPVKVVPILLDFTLVLNPGAVFGMGAGKRWFFVGFTLLAILLGLLAFAKWTTRRQWHLHVALGLILGGGLGNLYDRVVFACVRDFLHPLPGIKLPFGWSWPWGGNEVWPYVSNLADLFLIIGVCIVGWVAIRTPIPSPPPQPHTPPPPSNR